MPHDQYSQAMSQAMKLWRTLFGEDLTPNDAEIIGVDTDGSVLFYNAEDGTCYNNGQTVDTLDGEGEQLNEREHIVTHPLQYVVLLRMSLQACLPNKGSKRGKPVKEIRAIVERALSSDPQRYVTNLRAEARYRELKQELS